MTIDRRRFLSRSSAAVAVWLPFARLVRSMEPTRDHAINVRDYGAVGDGISDDSHAVQAAIHAAQDGWVYFPQGTYRFSSIEAVSARIFGAGAASTRLELSSTSTDNLFVIGKLELCDLSVSDRGRSGLDRAENPNVHLFKSETSFQATNCTFHTNRSVLSQASSRKASTVVVHDCSVKRLAAATPGEQDRMNLFTCCAEFLHFRNLRATALLARSVINAMYTPDPRIGFGRPSAIIEDCTFDYIHNAGTSGEVKVVFIQGYEGVVRNNEFLDCFGRHVDLLRSPSHDTQYSPFFMNLAAGNKIHFSKQRQASLGASNHEAGSIYCRYANAHISDNFQDFTNLQLQSAGYHAISVRHGYERAIIQQNIVIGAKGHAIEADISDSVDTGECSVLIVGNQVSSVRSTRHPISIANHSKNKFFDLILIKDNVAEYAHDSAAIIFERATERQSIFTVRNAKLTRNYNISFNSRSEALFIGLPLQLYAPDTDIRVRLENHGSKRLESADIQRQIAARLDYYLYKSISFKR